MKYPLVILACLALLQGCGGGGSESSAQPIPDSIADDDNDGLSNEDEQSLYASDPNDPHDPVRYGHLDHDADGLANAADPDYDPSADSDNDGLSNDWEYSQSLDPANAEILLTQERFFSVVTTEYSWIKLSLKAPNGEPIANKAFHLSTNDPALLQGIYPAKGWVSDNDGVIEAPIIALGTGRSNLYLVSPENPGSPIEIADIDSTLEAYTDNPADDLRSFSSVKENSTPGSGNARSMLQSNAAWTPETKTGSEWIELPVQAGTRVSALKVQGHAVSPHWVRKLKISYEIAPGYREFANDGMEFNASVDRNSLVRIPFNAPAGISRIRIHPSSWFITPAMRVALEVSSDPQTPAITQDSDNDGFNDLLESRIGSDRLDANSPRLHNPSAFERRFSSIESGATIGSDGADSQLMASAWRPDTEDNSPWITMELPEGQRLVGVALQGDNVQNRWVSALRYSDNSVPGLSQPLLDNEAQASNSDANTQVNHWLLQAKQVRTLKVEPLTWENGVGMRLGLWVVDTVATNHSNPLYSDSDGDGLNALQEQALGSNSNNSDSDGDGLSDGVEVALGANPNLMDSDQDGLSDRIEQLVGSDLSDGGSPGLGGDDDFDNDGLSSAFELVVLQTDPDAADSDGDGLSDYDEINLSNTDPSDEDSDDDTLSDFEESGIGSNANLISSPVSQPLHDWDDDGLNAAREYLIGTDPLRRDTDADGLIDGQEFSINSNPLDVDSPVLNGHSDSDNDGLSAATEYLLGAAADDANDPLNNGNADLDGDGVANAADPDYLQSGDFDGDGIGNQIEYDTGNDPTDSNSPTLGGAFDRDGDGIANGGDADFILLPGDDSDSDGLSDMQEYALGHSAINSHVPLTAGGEDIDTDTVVNNLDADYQPEGDDDSDGWNNEFEYRAGTNPRMANTATDFNEQILSSSSGNNSPIKHYPLATPGTGTPFYVHNPHLLPRVTIEDTTAIEASRDTHSGFDTQDISFSHDGGSAHVINNTPRRLSNIALRNISTGAITLVEGTVLPFSRALLSAAVTNSEVVIPNPLGQLHTQEFQAYNSLDGSQRVQDASLDDYQRVSLGHKLALNHPALWQHYANYSASGCSTDICQSSSIASETMARLFYQEKPIALAFLNAGTEHNRASWQNKLAIKAADLVSYSNYQSARALSLGLESTNAWVEELGDALDELALYSLVDAANTGTAWTESGILYSHSVDSDNQILRLKLYHDMTPVSLYLFSEASSTDAVSVSFEAATGEFVLELSASQWQKNRLALAFEDINGDAMGAILIQWGSTVDSWTDEALSCTLASDDPCTD